MKPNGTQSEQQQQGPNRNDAIMVLKEQNHSPSQNIACFLGAPLVLKKYGNPLVRENRTTVRPPLHVCQCATLWCNPCFLAGTSLILHNHVMVY